MEIEIQVSFMHTNRQNMYIHAYVHRQYSFIDACNYRNTYVVTYS